MDEALIYTLDQHIVDHEILGVTSGGGGGGTLTGAGTPGYLSKWATPTDLGDSLVSDDGTNVAFNNAARTAQAIFDLSGLPTARTFSFPNASGTFALTSDLSVYQPLDADLTAIAALSTAGFPARTAADTWAQRTITVTAPVTISNGDGVSGNPLIGVTGLSGTNTGDVTLAGTPDYITISGQVITRALIDLDNTPTAHVTGTLAVANGGTGAATFTANGVIYGSGTSALGVTAAGTTGQVLTGVTGNPPAWSTFAGAGLVTGAGTTNTHTMWTSTSAVGNSSFITETSGALTITKLATGSSSIQVQSVLAGGGGGTITATGGDATTATGSGGSFIFVGGASGILGAAGGVSFTAADAVGTDKDGGIVSFRLGAETGSGVPGFIKVFNGALVESQLKFPATATRTYTYPDAAGTIALTSDLASYQPLDSDLTSWAGVTRASGFDTFATTPSSANLKALITDELGSASGKAIFAEGTLAITSGKTLTATNSLTLSGTDSTTMTFPTTTATIARTDAAQTFTGVQTFTSQDVHDAGVSLSTSGAIDMAASTGLTVTSNVANSAGLTAHLFKNSVALINGTARVFGVDRWTTAGGGSYLQTLSILSNNPTVAGAERMRFGFDANNYFQVQVSSAGVTTLSVAGTGATFTLPSGTNLAAPTVSAVTTGDGSFSSTVAAGTGTLPVPFGFNGINARSASDTLFRVQDNGTTKFVIGLDAGSVWVSTLSADLTLSGNLTISAKNIITDTTTGTKIGTATTQKLGFFNAAPIVQPSAFTQTYATATKTHSNLTSATLTDSSGGTANTTVQALTDPVDTPITADALRDDLVANLIPQLRNNFADLTAQCNALRVDLENAKQVLNAVIDDDQSLGLKS